MVRGPLSLTRLVSRRFLDLSERSRGGAVQATAQGDQVRPVIRQQIDDLLDWSLLVWDDPKTCRGEPPTGMSYLLHHAFICKALHRVEPTQRVEVGYPSYGMAASVGDAVIVFPWQF